LLCPYNPFLNSAPGAGCRSRLRRVRLATRLITLHRICELELKALLGIPERVATAALIPLGYPDGTFKRRPRLPLGAVAYADRWEQAFE